MVVLECNKISKSYDGTPVLTDASFRLMQGEKVGLIGANGAGKSTLVKMVAGHEYPTAGSIGKPTGASVGYLEQELHYADASTVGSEMLQVFATIRQLGTQMEQLAEAMATGDEKIIERYGRLAAEYEQQGGYTYEHRIDAVLDGLGLSQRRDQPVAALSGGEKNVLALARILLAEPDILLLDEPANHLDFAGLEWLEGFLRDYPRTVLLVSHNRYLLDRVVSRIVEVEYGQLAEYPGNYSAYRAEKMKRLLKQQAAYQDQQKEIQRLEAMIKRCELWGSMTDDPRHARRARNKQRMIDRMDKIDRPDLDGRRIDPRFGSVERAGHIALELRGYSKAFDERVLFDAVDLHIAYGERVGLLGANGSGKSTLFRDIVEQGAWDHPALRLGPQIRLGYYAQEHQTLDPNRTLIAELQEQRGVTKDRAFQVLSRFLFSWEDVQRPIASLSGGEKSRVQLAKLVLADVNFLLLDEPTNHLDIQSREQVEEALEEFDGAILAISHDRYFLDRIVDRIVEVATPSLADHPGNFSDYWRRHGSSRQPPPRAKKDGQRRQPPRREHQGAGAAQRLEARIETLEGEKRQLESDLAEAYRRRDNGLGDKLGNALRRLNDEIETLYREWERVA